MNSINTPDINSKAVSELLLHMYDMPKGVNFFEQVLHLMQGYVPFQVSGYSVVDIQAKALDMKMLQSQEGENVPNLSELEKFILTHPLRDVCYHNDRGAVVGTIDLMAESEWKKTPLYNEVHRKLGLVHDTSMRFYMGTLCVSFAFCDKKPLGKEYYDFLNLIAPHLGPAHKTLKLQRRGLLDHLPDNVILISKNQHLDAISPLAVRLLHKYFSVNKRVTEQLPDDVWSWIRYAMSKGEGGQILISKLSESTLALSLLRTAEGYLILLEESITVVPKVVLSKMGLTKREAEVALWASQGKQNREVASILSISSGTVRKHMEHIMKKLHCETRGAVAEVVLRKLSDNSSKILPPECLTCTRTSCLHCSSHNSIHKNT
ncbi:MAG: LuxR C-terminal-related transcriptional regulator [Desulfovibrio sp.]